MFYIWQWDKAKSFTHQVLSTGSGHILGTQVSFSPVDQNTVLITGP